MNKYLKKLRGGAMVEFAIVAPLMVMLVFGITELGRALYQLNTLSKSASAGARYLARLNNSVDLSYSAATGLLESCTTGANWDTATNAATNLVVYGSESGGANPLLPNMNVEFDPMPHVPDPVSDDGASTTGCVISVKVSADFVSVFGGDTLVPFTNIQPISFSEVVQERYIGE